MKKLSHVDARGRARMVDVSRKPDRVRVARARGRIRLAPGTVALVRRNRIAKGDVLTVAEIAGVQAAKRTFELIPLCHPLSPGLVDVKARIGAGGVTVESTVACTGPTGAEMEALTAVSVALLAVYDMCKAVDGTMQIGDVRLVEKRKEDPAP